EDGIRDLYVTGVQTCALPICPDGPRRGGPRNGFPPPRRAAPPGPAGDRGRRRVPGGTGQPGPDRRAVGTARTRRRDHAGDPDWRWEERRVGKEGRRGSWGDAK